jgi:alpha-glucosidase
MKLIRFNCYDKIKSPVHGIVEKLVLRSVICVFLAASPVVRAALTTITSPDGHLAVAAGLDAAGRFNYDFTANDRQLIKPSLLGLDFGSVGKMPDSNWKVLKTKSRSVNSIWKPVWGKRASVPDSFHETVWELAGPNAPFDRMTITVRVYDDGFAFRYAIPSNANGAPANAVGDLAAYNFAGDFTSWFYNGEYHNLGPDKLSVISSNRQPPMTVRAATDAFLAVHEADLRLGEPLQLAKSGLTSFRALAAPGKIAPGYESPWRVILFGTSPGALVDSHLIELLNPPPPVGTDFSWVKPGVGLWDWRINGAQVDGFKYSMSLPSWKRMVDFAAENKFMYLVLDADWYGPEFNKDSHPTKGGKVDQVREIIAYGKAKGVGIWLYLNDVGGREFPLEETLKHYADWGAVGVKYGFMSGTMKEKNVRTRRITELCAQNHLLCDFHDYPVHPYGQMRTWPNAVTREFCHSQLDAHRVFQPKTFVTTVFVNGISGPLDMNNGLADLTQTGRVDNGSPVPSTLVGEVARTLIVFSGVTIIPDIPEHYRKHPELLQFLAAEKQPWRESKTLAGVIGEYIVTARQAADGRWLVGAASNEDARELDIPLDFLGRGKYSALILQDGDDADYRTHKESYKVSKQIVTRGVAIHVRLAAGGGACVLLEKTK